MPSANRPLPPRRRVLTRRHALTLPLLTLAVGAAAACNDSVPVPTAGASSNHKGIDISASTGSSIVAAAGGTVSIATYSYSAGNYVVVNHGNGLSTVYMHCSQLLVSAGDTVKAGQTIAKVGSTGYSTGSHLHFAVRKNGSYVNPSSYVSP